MTDDDEIRLIPVRGLPEISPDDDLASLILSLNHSLSPGDVVVVAQKIVSKSEGRLVNLETVKPSARAVAIAEHQQRDSRLVEVILSESKSIIREDAHVIITETHHGFICANAGVDRSNVVGPEWVSLLPVDPDESARKLRARFRKLAGVDIAVIVTDTFGRAWRQGLTNVAIGVAGLNPLLDFRGQVDDHGKDLVATVLAIGDELAAASGLLMRKTTRIPAVIIRGYRFNPSGGDGALSLIRPKERDPFQMITALAGGVGASKFLDGLVQVTPAEEITIIVNTGDDIELFGLYIAPDLDIVTYTLAGIVNPATGWGVAGDTFDCLNHLKLYGAEHWFNLGDRDLATHIWRTLMLREGKTLSAVSEHIRQALGIASRILPMTDLHTPTTIVTSEGPLHFQEYLVKRRAEVPVQGIRFENIEAAIPAVGVIEAIRDSEVVIVCPSNPLISIGPILSVPGIRDALRQTGARVIAISPIVGGASLKGPTDRMLKDLKMEVSALQIARMYADFVDVYVIDHSDEELSTPIEETGVEVFVTNTVMSSPEVKIELAHSILRECARS